MSRRALALVIAVVVVGCASQKVYRDGTPTISGKAGERVVIELASDPGSGYSWMLTGQPDPTVATLMETDFVIASGTAGHQRWTFRFVAPGTSTITFSYGRTWEHAPAQKATMFTVTVR